MPHLLVRGASVREVAGTHAAWIVAAVWTVLMIAAILMEEKELGVRFGASYEDYCRRVPRFIPSLGRSANL